jgi:ligand-binding sensor domain-containing protein/signal transduction histidine kinase/DNA-binding response OmpR family regulator
MKLNSIISVFIFLILSHNLLFSQIMHLQFSNKSVEDGLSQSAVMAICQDDRGYMWFGTQDGLNKYNSVEFIIYRNKPNDSLSLPSNAVSEIYKDRRGNIWVGTTSGLATYIPDMDVFKAIPVDQRNNIIDGMEVTSFLHDRDDNLWIGTTIGLFKWIKGEHTNVERLPTASYQNNGLPGSNIQNLYQDKHGKIWVGTTNGLCRLEITTDGGYEYYTYQYKPGDPSGITHNFISVITEDLNGNLWISTRGGLNKFEKESERIIQYTSDKYDLIDDFIRHILVDHHNNIWIGTYRGLSHLDQQNGIFTNYIHDPDNPYSLSDNSIHSMYKDIKGTIWIGTFFAGVNLLDEDINRFDHLRYNHYKNSINYDIISAMVEDENGNIWIGTEGKGLNYYDRQQDVFHHYTSNPDLPNTLRADNIKTLYLDHNNNLWVGTYRGGLSCKKAGTTDFKQYLSYPTDIFAIREDKSHRLWIGTFGEGLWTYDSINHNFFRYDKSGDDDLALTDGYIRVVFEDSRGNLWIGTQDGLNVRFNDTNKFIQYRYNHDDPNSLSNNIIFTIKEDSKGRVWIGTYGGGLNIYDFATNNFKKYTKKDGLPGDNIIGILEDDDGHLWLSTNNGLCKFNPSTGHAFNFDVRDGLPGNEFNFNSFLKTSTGEMYFGSKKGFTYFHPDKIKESIFKAPIVFTGLKLFNNPVSINGSDGLLKKDISLTNSIVFNYKQNVFTVDFALLSYLHPKKNKYAYKLEGLEDEWNFVTIPSATYTNLDHGLYTLLVRAANNDGVWTDNLASLEIEVLPPPWKTWWAYLLYLVIVVTLLLIFANFIRIRTKLEHDLHLEHLEKEKERDLHQLKLQFFTNISHEIRTPLTLIIGPLQNIIEKYGNDNYLYRQLVSVKNNADRMLRLVNQLMDLKKQEIGKLKIQAAQGNIVKFIKEIKLSFQEKALIKNIDYQLNTESDEILVWYDRDEFEKVLFNLLSNAFKFTPEGGKIYLNLRTIEKDTESGSKGFLKIEIEDNGIGIPAAHVEKIFERFYQVDKSSPGGSGIGLALSRGIVDLHHGEISVESKEMSNEEPGKTVFTVLLPLGNSHLQEHEMINDFVDSEQIIGYIKNKGADIKYEMNTNISPSVKPRPAYSLLIVEDNDQIRSFIKEVLTEKFRIYEAANGVEGWDTALRRLPDLIISDVVMPEMDGIELCRKLKTDERTSHIPVMLLTARTALIHKVNGYETGADEYVTKPFDIKLLEVRVNNLIESRIQMRKKFGNKVLLEPTSVATNSTDEKFLNKAIAIVEANILDEDFNVTTLAKEIGMSQPVLFRKIKALTNMNIADFIKSIRLKKAVTLLQNQELTVAEIAMEVGYSDPKYFSKIFKKYYGKLPSAYSEG